jgi:hypothetical protein
MKKPNARLEQRERNGNRRGIKRCTIGTWEKGDKHMKGIKEESRDTLLCS